MSVVSSRHREVSRPSAQVSLRVPAVFVFTGIPTCGRVIPYGPLRNTCKPFAVLPRAPPKSGLGLAREGCFALPVASLPDQGLAPVDLPGGPASATPLKGLRAPENPDGGFASATPAGRSACT